MIDSSVALLRATIREALDEHAPSSRRGECRCGYRTPIGDIEARSEHLADSVARHLIEKERRQVDHLADPILDQVGQMIERLLGEPRRGQ